MISSQSRSGRVWFVIIGLVFGLPMLVGQGCPPPGGAPVVTITAPSITQEAIIGSSVQLIYTATNPGGGSVSVRAFYDRDGTANTGDEVEFGSGLSVGENKMAELDTSGLAEGNIYLGIVAVNSNGTTLAYAAGVRTLVIGTDSGQDTPTDGSQGGDGRAGGIAPGGPSDIDTGDGSGDGNFDGSQILVVTTPASDIKVIKGTVFTIRWRSKLQLGQGVIDIFREPDVNKDNKPDGAGSRVIISQAGLDASTLSFEFDTTGLAGKYYIGATVTPVEGDTVTKYAPGSITIIRPMLWVGVLETTYDNRGNVLPLPGPMEGVTFQGVSAGDNLGSAMVVSPDYNQDGIGDLVLAAQNAKPGYQANVPNGGGAGEAYLIYGQAGRGLVGTVKVNQVGSSDLPGVVFSGIFPNPHTSTALQGNPLMDLVHGFPDAPNATEGLRGIMVVPDQDGDGIDELAFSFPFCDSYSLTYQISDGYHPAPLLGLGRLENNGQFMKGGVVFLSSKNSLLQDETAKSRHADRTIMLHEVGQVFSSMSQIRGLQPRPDSGGGDGDEEATGDFAGVPIALDVCPLEPDCGSPNVGTVDGDGNDTIHYSDIIAFPGEGFTNDTYTDTVFPIFGLPRHGESSPGTRAPGTSNLIGIDPPRLADPLEPYRYVADGGFSGSDVLQIFSGETLNANQIDAPAAYFGGKEYVGCISLFQGPGGEDLEPYGTFPPTGWMRVTGTGFYYDNLPLRGGPDCPGEYVGQYAGYCPSERLATPLEPYGARLFGQANQRNSLNSALREIIPNRFGHSMAMSGEFMLFGTPDRTVIKGDVDALRNNPAMGDREMAGEIYMLQLVKESLPRQYSLWDSQDGVTLPTPHQYIIKDLGYSKCVSDNSTGRLFHQPGHVSFEMMRPFHIVGAAAGDRIGDVTALDDMNNDGLSDIAVGGAGTNGDRGAIYVLYRRQPELETDYLLEKLHIDPSNTDRMNGLYIVGEPGERLGTSMAQGSDFNNDGFPDMLIGSPNKANAAGSQAGEVFILYGGANLLSPQGGVTLAALRDSGDAMVLAGDHKGNHTGTTVADAGDVDGDGISDILIAAPDASPRFDSTGDGKADAIGVDFDGDMVADDLNGDGKADNMEGAGLVYLVFGGDHLTGTITLSEIGTKNLPGLTIVGKKGGDHLGGGITQKDLLSRGIASAGDVDGDGKNDFMISSILADPEGKTDAGEIYLLYGGFDFNPED